MFKAVIAGYSRSPFTPAKKGKLANVKPDDLLSDVIKNLISKSKVNPEDIEDVIIGSASVSYTHLTLPTIYSV